MSSGFSLLRKRNKRGEFDESLEAIFVTNGAIFETSLRKRKFAISVREGARVQMSVNMSGHAAAADESTLDRDSE